MNNWQEWRCHTDPTNETSFLVLHDTRSGGKGFGPALAERGGRAIPTETFDQFDHGCVRLPCADQYSCHAVDQLGNGHTAVGSGPWFYRVGVEKKSPT